MYYQMEICFSLKTLGAPWRVNPVNAPWTSKSIEINGAGGAFCLPPLWAFIGPGPPWWMGSEAKCLPKQETASHQHKYRHQQILWGGNRSIPGRYLHRFQPGVSVQRIHNEIFSSAYFIPDWVRLGAYTIALICFLSYVFFCHIDSFLLLLLQSFFAFV